MNFKAIGEIGESCTIGELAKWCIDVALPLSDNHPFDSILIVQNKVFRAQIKSSSQITVNGAISFGLETNNWYLGTSTGYSANDIDIVLCYNFVHHCLYLLGPEEFQGKRSISIRFDKPKNNGISTCHFHEELLISKERIKKVLGVDTVNISEFFTKAKDKEYKIKCRACLNTFTTSKNWLKFCSSECRNGYLSKHRKSNKPPREELANLLKERMPWVRIGAKYGVTDNAVRKWARSYGLI